jgi:hypothetical protein
VKENTHAFEECLVNTNNTLRLEQETLHLQDLEASLMEEWASPEDEEAFADL